MRENRRFYDSLWSGARLILPHRFNTWPLVSSLLAPQQMRLEVAPGLRPRLPLEDTLFLDISAAALGPLRAAGSRVMQGQIGAIPLPSATVDFLCAFDVIEHVDDEDGALSELSRVARPGAVMLASVPLHPDRWTPFDDFVGHRRRYEPERLLSKLDEHGFDVERSAVYGLQAKSSRLLDAGMWWLTHFRDHAMWWYNLCMPLSLSRQPTLALQAGLIDATGVDEVLLVCRKR
ncbi:MAG: methyltransferase domain-containing protein [Rhodocyclaceae bacterium]